MVVRSDWIASVTRNQASDQPETGPGYYNDVHPICVEQRLVSHRSFRCQIGADRLVSTPHYKRSVFLALESRFERELIAALLQADAETCVCEFTPDGTEPTLWMALHKHSTRVQISELTTLVVMKSDAQWESIAHRLLDAFDHIVVVIINPKAKAFSTNWVGKQSNIVRSNVESFLKALK